MADVDMFGGGDDFEEAMELQSGDGDDDEHVDRDQGGGAPGKGSGRGKGRGRGRGRAKSAAAKKPAKSDSNKVCFVAQCERKVRSHSKFCQQHSKDVEAIRYQAKTKKDIEHSGACLARSNQGKTVPGRICTKQS